MPRLLADPRHCHMHVQTKNALANLPYVIDGETVVTQSNACLLYLGRKLGLMGGTKAETAKAEQTLMQVFDLRNDAGVFSATVAMTKASDPASATLEWLGVPEDDSTACLPVPASACAVGLFYSPKQAFDADLAGHMADSVDSNLGKLEAWLVQHDTPYLAGMQSGFSPMGTEESSRRWTGGRGSERCGGGEGPVEPFHRVVGCRRRADGARLSPVGDDRSARDVGG